MRVPASWLAELVKVADNATPESLHADFVSVGFEEEDVHVSGVTGPLVIGEVLEYQVEEHSNGKKIRWCQVRTGKDEVRGIVCGAHNFEVGDKVVVTLPGAVLPGDFKIAARSTYGHISDGMIASERELGLGDDHDGIITLARLGLDAEVGADAVALLGLDDFAVELNVTPDRGYAMSMRGLAREYALATKQDFNDPADSVELLPEPNGFKVQVDDKQPIRGKIGSPLFITRLISGVDPKRKSPRWLVSRLKLAGIRSISVIVDVTNYVMLEYGQPLHAYDLDKLQGGITVRRANPGEKLKTLDGQERKLSTEDLLITDDSGAIGLAGVMGGLETEITDNTSNVLLESAVFDSVSIARTARIHKLPSEASKRFARGIDSAVTRVALDRAAKLIAELAGGVAEDFGSVTGSVEEPAAITLPKKFAEKIVGLSYTDAQQQQILQAIGCEVQTASGSEESWSITPPTWRGDLTDKWTLVEEIARVHGYDNIPSELPQSINGRGLTKNQQLRRKSANHLAGFGAVEVLNYPFLSETELGLFGETKDQVMKLANPLDCATPYLRRSLFAGLAGVAHRNLSRGFTTLNIFEIGTVFRPEAGVEYGLSDIPPAATLPDAETLKKLYNSMPPQPLYAGGILLGRRVESSAFNKAQNFDWQDAIAIPVSLGKIINSPITVKQGSAAGFHPGRTAELFAGDGKSIGIAGQAHPDVADFFNIPEGALLWQLDLDALFALANTNPQAKPISTYPATTQDVSLVVAEEVPAGELVEVFSEAAGSLLEEARIVDIYRGEGIAADQKSVLLALRFRADDRTLTAVEATESKMAGVEALTKKYQARIRD
ncbi:MAG: phenylalanine--tRNA ligase subunit beta [Microbacteriaceae bacterium]|nr:phenylalanine--tRNA ligase subunit beta [Microbacteriaceae bacterium]